MKQHSSLQQRDLGAALSKLKSTFLDICLRAYKHKSECIQAHHVCMLNMNQQQICLAERLETAITPHLMFSVQTEQQRYTLS